MPRDSDVVVAHLDRPLFFQVANLTRKDFQRIDAEPVLKSRAADGEQLQAHDHVAGHLLVPGQLMRTSDRQPPFRDDLCVRAVGVHVLV